jgi:23S rRNA (cytosine1962-C5)-methyltransferase
MYKILRLKKNEERRLLAGHLWVYSNEIDNKTTPLKSFSSGELVQILSSSDRCLGIGYINPHTLLCARLLSRKHNTKIDLDFFILQIQKALSLRESIFSKPFYRLIFAESDHLPGLIVDRYNGTLVVQLTTAGTENLKAIIIEALIAVLNPTAILLRNDSTIREIEGLEKYVTPACGEPAENINLEENSLLFNVPILHGQKTGWFYDQRKNRSCLRKYVKNKRVLDVFCYAGAWGINAAVAGATEVYCVDSSDFALKEVMRNASLNKVADKMHVVLEDAFNALKNFAANKEQFAVIILDPPAFIKKRQDFEAGFNAYLRLHKLALEILSIDGILISTSCSQHLSREDLLNIIRQAGLRSNRELVILEQLHQAEDHPIHPAIPETNYLKGFVCR